MMRTIGVAIAIPEPYGSKLQRVRESFGDPLARSIPTHITLLPPTPVDDDDRETVDKHLREIAETEPPFDIHLRGTGTFQPVSPVVFVSVVLGIGDCERVESRVRSGPLDRELAFPYHPHVTVAHDLPQMALDEAFHLMSSYDTSFRVGGFCLFEHGTDGVWRPEREFPLGGQPPG